MDSHAGREAEEEPFLDPELHDEHEERDSLPPADTGWAAWSYVFGCYLVEGFCWGLALTFGVFQKHYSQDDMFRHSTSLPVIGTCATAMSFFLNPLISALVQKYPRLNIPLVWLGWAICIASLVAASFATRVWHLILTQGLLYGTGWAVCHSPWLVLLNQWFVQRRGLVYGIVFGASGIAAMILPFPIEAALERYGFRTTLRGAAVVLLVATGPSMLFIRPRLRHGSKHASRNYEGLVAFKRPAFLIFCAAFFAQGLGWFLPRFFMPSYAHDLSLSSEQSSTLLAVFGAAQVTGQMTLGWASDKLNIYAPTTASCVVSALATFLLWAPAKSFATLALFCALFGGFGGGYAVLSSRIAMYCTKDEANAVMVYCAISVMRGLSSVASGPISARLLSQGVHVGEYGLGKYRDVVIFVGVVTSVGALAGIGFFFTTEAPAVGGGEKSAHARSSSGVFLLQDREARVSFDEDDESCPTDDGQTMHVSTTH